MKREKLKITISNSLIAHNLKIVNSQSISVSYYYEKEQTSYNRKCLLLF